MLGYQINRSIVSLPQTLMKLTFRGYALNQPIPALPLLIHLHIESSNFNKPLDQQQPPSNLLPTSLTHLFLFSCEHPITHFPPNLTHLSFGCTFNQSIIGKLSQTLQSLELGYSFFLPLRSLPPSLKSLSGISFLFYLFYSVFIFIFIYLVLPNSFQ